MVLTALKWPNIMYGMAGSDLGLRIRRARERKRMTQQQLAAAIGAGSRSIGRWERGEAVPRSSLGALEAALAPYFRAEEHLPEPPADPRERELWDLAVQDMAPAEAWEVVEEYRRRAKRRIA